jgi:glycogen operon protein
MMVAGDEAGRTQQGNNNAYCQDNEISWLHWDQLDHELLHFTQQLIHFRLKHPAFCRRRWFRGHPVDTSTVKDIAWFLPDGKEMTDENWDTDFARSLGVYLNGLGLGSRNAKGQPIIDDSFYIIFNAHHDSLSFTLPPASYGEQWHVVLDTGQPEVKEKRHMYKYNSTMQIGGRSIVILVYEEGKKAKEKARQH